MKKTFNWEDISINIDGHRIEKLESINFSETKDKEEPVIGNIQNFNLKSKKDLLGVMKNIGIDLVFGANSNNAIGYTNSGDFDILDQKQIEHIALTTSRKEWEEAEFNLKSI